MNCTLARPPVSVGGCAPQPDVESGLTDLEIERVTKHLTGVTLAPGQAAGVRDMLARMRVTGTTDRAVQPALTFDPEVDDSAGVAGSVRMSAWRDETFNTRLTAGAR